MLKNFLSVGNYSRNINKKPIYMDKMPCSVPILTLNSEKYLEKCLQSLKDFQDVYLVDGNSTDKTLEIAKKFGIPVYKQVETEEKNIRIEDFSAMRNKSISFARCDWIFDIDSDEFLSRGLLQEIKEVFAEFGNEVNIGFEIEHQSIFGEKIIKHAFNYPSVYLRLYNKKSGIRFQEEKTVHEQLSVPLSVQKKTLKFPVYSYAPDTHEELIKKDNAYLTIARNKFFTCNLEEFSLKKRIRYIFLALNAFALNMARALLILSKSAVIYLAYGFSESLPPLQVWRHVRYHVIISFYRLEQLIRLLIPGGLSSKK
ncbi:MAG: hypothetical protein A3G52_03455 [Candidatus Taylorbacteria bacterium RIFCSPLOWO2_12_FULL_43_20]|uniref:Glycosyltransferase 2-like domain-containing protein n=1 Tax=Candidatus Taylorbacteria bacterium RIFCSPLOWO2_12_FULL_43_20 TaxID=1802332 RepID=A0A1G2P0I3_9BACT|nr:MAG: hypothetical protein A2825_02400 [Candidatus Taylorbacteria bacterium RIFCSPHIGHO2_01_FULL_43_120]OHA28343.1 MAG: hypothetical protein A3E92_00470 [Candidatus Taylorbacteria bacterium RIFCSPHIGHO2_12_FULL_42_34]OHA30617.1 MAG: hypothetical protein A3B09_00350 [Candidatus Taylorbacteria bacterium RIFCSPLOWO2_01_FULL_43_83]OHA38514.1 MAG: hypothetical protein A3H58_02995 [Candidatus Taylorbacteria bacterium RIFCSPLOWO2_02_FULL_43_22b]OHA41865.1 MAG: hypothetical protein A3G52_03455 [Candi